MPRVPQKPATKGSQKWLQLVVNEAPHLIDRAIAMQMGVSPGDKITWLSPLADDAYAEYRDEAFLSKLGVQAARMPLSKFWPRGGPRWDGLGRTSGGELFLVEAKAHIPELLSTATAASPTSRRTIATRLQSVKRALGSRARSDWSGLCYQYTNRLAHLFFLRALNRLPAFLVLVYFINASDVDGPSSAEEWSGAIRLVHALLGLDERRLQAALGHAVLDVFVDVRDVEAGAGGGNV